MISWRKNKIKDCCNNDRTACHDLEHYGLKLKALSPKNRDTNGENLCSKCPEALPHRGACLLRASLTGSSKVCLKQILKILKGVRVSFPPEQELKQFYEGLVHTQPSTSQNTSIYDLTTRRLMALKTIICKTYSQSEDFVKLRLPVWMWIMNFTFSNASSKYKTWTKRLWRHKVEI